MTAEVARVVPQEFVHLVAGNTDLMKVMRIVADGAFIPFILMAASVIAVVFIVVITVVVIVVIAVVIPLITGGWRFMLAI
jgi:hypothetical protein